MTDAVALLALMVGGLLDPIATGGFIACGVYSRRLPVAIGAAVCWAVLVSLLWGLLAAEFDSPMRPALLAAKILGGVLVASISWGIARRVRAAKAAP